MPNKTPMATFASDQDLLKAVRQAQASLDFEGMRATPEQEAAVIRAFRTGMSEDEYFADLDARLSDEDGDH